MQSYLSPAVYQKHVKRQYEVSAKSSRLSRTRIDACETRRNLRPGVDGWTVPHQNLCRGLASGTLGLFKYHHKVGFQSLLNSENGEAT
jgi:hypothetical protein